METKVYSSYKEIDRDLQILKLQKEIDVRKLSLSVEKTMDGLTATGMLRNLLGNAGSFFTKAGLMKNVLVPFLINRFLK